MIELGFFLIFLKIICILSERLFYEICKDYGFHISSYSLCADLFCSIFVVERDRNGKFLWIKLFFVVF